LFDRPKPTAGCSASGRRRRRRRRYYYGGPVRIMRWTKRVAGMGEMKNAYRVLVGKPERTRLLRMLRLRRNDVIKMIHKEIGLDDVD
jgi:hypothetical protein